MGPIFGQWRRLAIFGLPEEQFGHPNEESVGAHFFSVWSISVGDALILSKNKWSNNLDIINYYEYRYGS